ncbi:MAG: hypothetical protein MUC50_19465 [Myxococcota bacterium]|nr:hypothetical protein [Myxococcota bacterium]
MKKPNLASFATLFIVASWLFGCMNREPAPICPVPIQVTATDLNITGFDGVDLLVVIDNSGSMEEEQAILGTGFFTLINSLAEPIGANEDNPSADDIRVAVVTSDLGLQFSGTPGPADLQGKTDCSPQGDNGNFMGYAPGLTLNIKDDTIDCDADGHQCPTGTWSCVSGKCQAPGGNGAVSCPTLSATYAELTPTNNNGDLAFQVACMAQQGKGGCGYEQQLEAAVVGLNRHADFVRAGYLLAVLVVSDEEDCSLKDDGLFNTAEFKSPTQTNVACNYPASNETNFLYAATRYKEQYGNIKGNPNAVVFAAIVGVPDKKTICQGRGNEIGESCLADSSMQLKPVEYTDGGTPYEHFAPACIRDDDPSDSTIETQARPGRRYVDVARAFGDKGYVYSICNKDWSPAMKDIAELIRSQLGGTCYTDSLNWDPVKKVALCDVVANFSNPEKDQPCPEALVKAWMDQTGGSEGEYYAIVRRTAVLDDAKKFASETVACPLPKIPAALSCVEAEPALGDINKIIGWYYCEDNRPEAEGCAIKVQLTDAAQDETKGLSVAVQCLQQFSFEDENCQENTKAACSNGKDEDGNGPFDCCGNLPDVEASSEICDIDQGENYHMADPNCCPMTEDNGICVPDTSVCDGGPGNWPDACREAAKKLECTLPS